MYADLLGLPAGPWNSEHRGTRCDEIEKINSEKHWDETSAGKQKPSGLETCFFTFIGHNCLKQTVPFIIFYQYKTLDAKL